LGLFLVLGYLFLFIVVVLVVFAPTTRELIKNALRIVRGKVSKL
jgi:hypothetical protein